MAKSSGLAQDLWADGYQLGGDIGSINDASTPRGTQEVTGIDKSATERVALLSDFNIDFGAYFNDATGQIHTALKQLKTTDLNVMWILGTSIGSVVLMGVAKQIDYGPWTKAQDGSVNGATTAQGSAGTAPAWGVMLTAGKRTDTSATNGSSLDNAASSASGAEAMVQAEDFTGTSITIDVEDSPDDSAWTNLIVFTTISADNKSERKTVSGTVNRYLRVASNGTFNPVTFVVGIRRGESTDDVAYS
jgi:hypothetical protein